MTPFKSIPLLVLILLFTLGVYSPISAIHRVHKKIVPTPIVEPQEETSSIQGRHWNRNPFVFSGSDSADSGVRLKTAYTDTPVEPSLTLQGIWSAGASLQAMISGQIVKNGDSIGDFTVEKIFAQRVVVSTKDGALRSVSFSDNLTNAPGTPETPALNPNLPVNPLDAILKNKTDSNSNNTNILKKGGLDLLEKFIQ